jgi:hypothetical protein
VLGLQQLLGLLAEEGFPPPFPLEQLPQRLADITAIEREGKVCGDLRRMGVCVFSWCEVRLCRVSGKAAVLLTVGQLNACAVAKPPSQHPARLLPACPSAPPASPRQATPPMHACIW